ncbi:phosphatidylinositol 4,5-bisphosphate 5-phosphatase A-like isoform X1 [Tribolium madens]|uniref:phosphatidylinositol 4,5-bisphosphate 5-phosphatase A-like isoform X1 n=1 Tax=Tribolium madens TaxID=41895 RepID=UPI001CF75B1A|nr:phosphatidylinositol 4,5-bisphosphate 5-phosphatase A-like isoform X1 [Tribolium madens]
MENLRLYLGTYNVGTSTPDVKLNSLLGLPDDHKNDKFQPPDLYILSFQEVKAQPQNMLLDALFDDPWTYACNELLDTFNYVKIKSVRLQGLLLNVYCLRKHLLNVREIESEYTRTGLSGMWGNKGAVSVRLSIYGCSLCFVNSHLSAHDNQLKDRVEDYNNIIKDQEFHVDETTEIFFHDYVFWMGDLNFRLLEEYEQTPEEIERDIAKNELKKLFTFDQLRYVMRKGEAFSELEEKDPEFPPTFKFEVGTNKYDYKRRPAWCDRILYSVNPHNYENVTLKVDQLSYKHHPSYQLSDHKPVTAEFNIKIPAKHLKLSTRVSVDQVFSDYSERIVEFDKIVSWNQDEENKAKYKITKDIPATKDDWIGLFKDNFSGLDDYVTYEYVSKCASPTPEKKSPTGSSSKNEQKYEITFSELPNRCRGNYCLVYFSQSEDKVISVLGISNSFPIVKNDSD